MIGVRVVSMNRSCIVLVDGIHEVVRPFNYGCFLLLHESCVKSLKSWLELQLAVSIWWHMLNVWFHRDSKIKKYSKVHYLMLISKDLRIRRKFTNAPLDRDKKSIIITCLCQIKKSYVKKKNNCCFHFINTFQFKALVITLRIKSSFRFKHIYLARIYIDWITSTFNTENRKW